MWFYYYGDTSVQDEMPINFRFQCGSIITINTDCFGASWKTLDSNVVLLLRIWAVKNRFRSRDFRFQCGSIITVSLLQKAAMTRCFRFQCGSIITEYEGFTSKQARYFRFQCGSIITVCVCYLPNPVITLDSNVVLLLPRTPLTQLEMTPGFRFQCGSIITLAPTWTNPVWSAFRFQCGSIITHTFTI